MADMKTMNKTMKNGEIEAYKPKTPGTRPSGP